MADIELSAQDKIEEYKRELAAEGKTLDTVASDRLEKDLARMGVESSQIQDQYKIRRREGFPGFGFERQPQQTLSQILQRQEPPPAFFEGIPQAMQEAIARVNQQIVSEEPFVSPNVGRDVETRLPTSNERVNVPPITRAEPGSEVRGLSTPELSELGFGPNEPDNDGVRFIPDINKQIERLRQQEGSVAAGEAMLGSAVDYLDPNKQRVDDEAVRRQQTGAQRIAEKLFEEERKLKERNERIADVLTQKSRGIGRESTPEERASVLNDIVISFFEATYPQEEISIDDPRYKEIQDYILSSAYTDIFKKQGLKENQVGVVVDPDTGLFKAIPKEPLESGVGQTNDGRGLLGDVQQVFKPDSVQFVDTTWKNYTGILTPEKRERALNDLKVYETLSKEEKFPPELMDVVKTVAASKPGFGAGRQLSYSEIKDYLSRISYIESKHKNVSQIGGGPAVSAFQIEPVTANSLINIEKVSKKYFNSSSFNEALDDEFDRIAETNPELMSGYLSYKNQGEDKAVYKAMQDLSTEQIRKLLSISPVFAGSVAYAKILTGLKGNARN